MGVIKRTLLRSAAVLTGTVGLAIDAALTYLTAGGYLTVVGAISLAARVPVTLGMPFYLAAGKMLEAADDDAHWDKYAKSQAKKPPPPQREENTSEKTNDLSAKLANSNKATKAPIATAPAVTPVTPVTPPAKPAASVMSSPPNAPVTPMASRTSTPDGSAAPAQSSQIHATTNVAKTSTAEFLFDSARKAFEQKSESSPSSSPSGSIRLDHKGTDATMTVTKWPSDAATQSAFAWKMAEKFIQAAGAGNQNEIQITINPKKPEEAAYLMAALTAQGAKAKFANNDVYNDKINDISAAITSAKEHFAEMKKAHADTSSSIMGQPAEKEQANDMAPPADSNEADKPDKEQGFQMS